MMNTKRTYPKILSAACILILVACGVVLQVSGSAIARGEPAAGLAREMQEETPFNPAPVDPVWLQEVSKGKVMFFPIISNLGLEGSVPSPTSTAAPTLADTSTPTPTETPTITPTPTSTATATPTPTATNTPTPTATRTPRNTPTDPPPPTGQELYLSVNDNVSAVGSVANVSNEDIVFFDGTDFSLYFDGGDVGLAPTKLNTIYILDPDTILMSLNTDLNLPGVGMMQTWDILRFDATSLGNNTAGTFSMYFDGEDADLDTLGETIDAMDLLPDGTLLISTKGDAVVSGVMDGRDNDILAFSPTSLGDQTSGDWSVYFDGADVGLDQLNGDGIDGVAVASDGTILLSTAINFSLPGISGEANDFFVCIPVSLGNNTTADFSPNLYFDASAYGITTIILGFDVP
jgi:hypothetical protein